MSPSFSRARGRLRAAPCLVLLLLSTAAAAQTSRWTLRLGGLASDYERRSVLGYFDSTTYLDLDGGTGLQFAAEFRPMPHLGLEASVTRLDLDARLRETRLVPISFDPFLFEEVTIFEARGDFGVDPLAVAVLYHPFPRKRFDLRLGPQLAWVRFRVDVPDAPDRDPELAWGLVAGGDLRLGESPWSLGLELRHLEVQHDPTADRDLYTGLALDTAAVTIGYRLRSLR